MPEKYKEEIEEILKQTEELQSQEGPTPTPPPIDSRRHVIRLPRIGLLTGLPRFSAGNLMLAAFSLFLAAIVLMATGGPVMLFVLIGLGLFVAAYIMFFARPGSGSSVEKRWRGRLVEDKPSDLLGRFRRWLRG